MAMDQSDKDWIAAQLSEIDNPEEDFETELFLSTDGKHTVKVKALTNDTRPKALKFAQKLFDRVLERYGSKQSTSVREYDKAEEKAKQPDLGTCSKCGTPNKLSSKGKPYCGALCWKK